MFIYPKNAGLRLETAAQTPDLASTATTGLRANVKAPAVQPAADRADKGQISDVGRALVAREGDSSSSLTSLRAAAIRDRVLSGAYDTLDVVDSVARRLLDSGDI